MRDWMAELASHYEANRRRYPNDRLMVVFDIDGTIVDTRNMVLELLRTYDRLHGTRLFVGMDIEDIQVPESRVAAMVADLGIPEADREAVMRWYEADRWSSVAVFESHRPYAGVLEVIRWFQIQPNTCIGLNTTRTERARSETLRSLNELGKEFRVSFSDDMLYMRPDREWKGPVAKVAGVRHFEAMGYRVIAFVDNEPSNLEALAQADPEHRILLLHADTLFESKRSRLPTRTVGGRVYDVAELMNGRTLPHHIQFVWQIADGHPSLSQFLDSDIHWVRCDVHLEPIYQQIALHPASEQAAGHGGDGSEALTLAHALEHLDAAGKGACINLQAGGALVDRTVELVHACGFPGARLWFCGRVEDLHQQGFQDLAQAYPDASLQCPIDFLAPLIVGAPAKAKDVVDMLTSWGINRFSIDWQTPDIRLFFDQMDRWGFEVTIRGVPDPKAFLQAVLLMPHSIASDFGFPRWTMGQAPQLPSDST